MKKQIKNILPSGIISTLANQKRRLVMKKLFDNDRERYQNSAFLSAKHQTYKNLIGRIIFYYHSIEKGLSHKKFRPGFGVNALSGLMNAIREYEDNGFDTADLQYKTGIGVIHRYVERHQNLDVDVTHVKNWIESTKIEDIGLGGVIDYNTNDIYKEEKMDFKELCESRRSVRDFGELKLELNHILNSINLAFRTPSVCNRQPWMVYLIRNMKTISELLEIQKGFKGFGENIDSLIVITSDSSKLSNAYERNQGHIDSGMLSMSLLYSLHYNKIASCPLNANFEHVRDEQVRKILNIPNSENLTMFIAIGSYPNTFVVPNSVRSQDLLKVVE
jgi:nitroreductase